MDRDDGHVRRNGQAHLVRGVQRADGGGDVGDQHGRRPLVAGHQRRHGRGAAGRGVVGVRDQPRVDGQAGCPHRRHVPGPAAARGVGGLRSGQVGDPAVAEPDQVLDREPAAPLVVEDHVPAGAVHTPVDQNPRQPQGAELLEFVAGFVAGEQQAVDSSLREQVDVVPAGQADAGRTRGHQPVSEAARGHLRALDDLRVDRVGEVRDEQVEHERPRRAQAPRGRVRPVPELLDGLQHPLPRLRPDVQVRVLVDDPGDDGTVHTSERRYVIERDLRRSGMAAGRGLAHCLLSPHGYSLHGYAFACVHRLVEGIHQPDRPEIVPGGRPRLAPDRDGPQQ